MASMVKSEGRELRLAYGEETVAGLRTPTEAEPWRILVSACLRGAPCGIDGTDYGMGQALGEWPSLSKVTLLPFCPEEHALGTPRTMPDIHGGDGFDVLDGRARVLDERGADLSEAMIRGGEAMVAEARRREVDFAILTDMSGACGTQVISDGCRLVEARRYRRGVGVAAAMLLRAGVPVISQRDYRTLALLRRRLDPSFVVDPDLVDHHQTLWVRENLSSQ